MGIPLAEKELGIAMLDVAYFNASSSREGMMTVKPLAAMPNEVVALARRVSFAFGCRLHMVETMRFECNKNIINGMANDGIAYVSYPTLHDDVLWTIGHEMWHAGEQVAPQLFDPVLVRILADCHPGLVAHRRQFESDKTVTDRHVQSEVMADFNGEMWIDPLFWKALATTSHPLELVGLFDEMVAVLESEARRGRFGIRYFNKEICVLRNEFVGVWASKLAAAQTARVN
jgi:hypothetical protein